MLQNPKFEYRNPKPTQRQINLKSGKSKTPNPKEACLEFYIFGHLKLFRISDPSIWLRTSFVLRIFCPWRPFDCAQDMLCVSARGMSFPMFVKTIENPK